MQLSFKGVLPLLRLTVLSTDTGLAVNAAEHFYTCYHEAIYIYVSVEEANGYTTIFDVWAGYNFPYVKTTQAKSTDQKPDSSF